MSCVNINSREFKTLLDEVNLSSSALELIIHKIQNSENSDRFPSAEEVNNLLKPKSFTGDYNMIEVWEKQYSSPINFPTLTLANEEYNNAVKIFGKDSVSIVERKNGTYDLMVGNPTFESEYKYILSNAKRDSEGNLLAPNGKKSNLDERQYAQVRTKAFKEWFGDWENNPSEASKVVDENGEPLVVYHHRKSELYDFSKRTDNIMPGIYFSKKPLTHFGNYQIQAFLNIKNPVKDYHEDNLFQEDIDYYKKINIDGKFTTDFEDETNTKILEYVAFNPNQIKSATDNVGTFNTTDDNIRHSSITEHTAKVASISTFTDRLPIPQQAKFAAMVSQGDVKISCM